MSGKPAARVTDPTSCPVPGHGTNPITSGSADVRFDNLPAARLTDKTACGSSIASDVSSTVWINGLNAALMGSTGDHGNVVIGGSGSVMIGDSVVVAAFTPPSPMAASHASTVQPQPVAAATGAPLAPITPARPAAPSAPAAPADPVTAAVQVLSSFKNSTSTKRVFNDTANPMGTPDDPFEKSKVFEQLKVRVARAHGHQMPSQMRVPTYPHQDEASLCGPAAFFYALLMDRPDLYTQAIIDLWETGEATIGQLHIKPGYDCRNPKNFSRRSGGDRIIAIDWISLASLCDSENGLLDYDSPDDKTAGITLPSTLESWFVRAGATVVFDNIQLGSISQTRFVELLGHLGPQHRVVSLVSASMVEGGVGVGKNHWIVWEGKPETSGGIITAATPLSEQITSSNLFSWGAVGHQVTRGFTLKQMLSDIFGGRVFSRFP